MKRSTKQFCELEEHDVAVLRTEARWMSRGW